MCFCTAAASGGDSAIVCTTRFSSYKKSGPGPPIGTCTFTMKRCPPLVSTPGCEVSDGDQAAPVRIDTPAMKPRPERRSTTTLAPSVLALEKRAAGAAEPLPAAGAGALSRRAQTFLCAAQSFFWQSRVQ